MYFDSFSEFIAMGGHGLYVWLSYGIFVVVIIWNILNMRINRKQSIKKAKRTWSRENNRQPSIDKAAESSL